MTARTASTADEALVRYSDAEFSRPIPMALRTARGEVWAAVETLRGIPDASLASPWPWKGAGEAELRYGFYRIGEAFELAGIDAQTALRSAGGRRGRAADLIAPATAARWDLLGLLVGIDDGAWGGDPGGDEWTIRQTLGHVISGQRYYGVATAWWQDQNYERDETRLPATTPEAVFEGLPTEEAEAEGSPAEVRERLDSVLDCSAERLAGLPAERLDVGARWSGFAVDVGFRLGRWSSHLREHTVQVEKTLVTLERHPTEVDRLVRLVLAAWGRAEAAVYGSSDADAAVAVLANAAAGSRATATEIAELATT